MRGLRVTVLHDCWTGTDREVRHEAPIPVHEVTDCTFGKRYRGVRCDGSRIEWMEGE